MSEEQNRRVLAPAFSPLCLLVADGSAEIRRGVRDLLEAARYRVLEAADGADALTILALIRERVVVLVGADLPDMDTTSLLAAIRTSPVTRDAGHVCLAMTDDAAAEPAAPRGALQALDVPVLNRPPQAPELYRQVASAVVCMVAPSSEPQVADRPQR